MATLQTAPPRRDGLAAALETDQPRVTARQFQVWWETGRLNEDTPVELLDGRLVLRDRGMGDGLMADPRQEIAVIELRDSLMRQLAGAPCHVRTEMSAEVGEFDVPFPDVFVVQGRAKDYRDGPPTAADILFAAEVANTSLRRDRGSKSVIYAEGGVSPYLILDVNGRTGELRVEPDPATGGYSIAKEFAGSESIKVEICGRSVTLVLSELFADEG